MDLTIRIADRPGDLGWMLQAHGEQYAAEFGWDASFEAQVARIVADFAATRDDRNEGWIAESNGRRVGCVLCIADAAPGTARLRILLVNPTARGHSLGRRLAQTCVDFARARGYRRLVLWTNDPLVAAGAIYRSLGFRLVAQRPHHSYGVDLVGQDYALDLAD